MSSVPLHPAIVHIPLGVALIMPLLVIGFAVALWKGRLPKPAWLAVVVLQAVLFGGALAALKTGHHEEDRVEKAVSERYIESHEDRADVFVWAAGATLALALLALFVPAAFSLGAMALTAVATLVVLALGIRTGKSGGELVYVHGAASAYATPGGATPALEGAGQAAGGSERRDDDE